MCNTHVCRIEADRNEEKKNLRTHDNSSKYYKLFVFASWFISSRVKVFALVLNSRSKIVYKFTEIYGYIGTLTEHSFGLLGYIYSVNARGS